MKPIAAFALLGLLLSGASAQAAEPWEQAVAAAIGKPGTEMPGGVYRIGLPRSDLHVVLDGVRLKPALALGSWLAFAPHGGGQAMVMGDLVLTDTEVNPVMAKLIAGGIEITALHNHLLRNTPHTMYMHIAGHGDPAQLAKVLHDALALSGTPLSAPAAAASVTPETIDLDTAALDRILGHKGKIGGGVYAFGIPRAEMPRDGGMALPPAMGSAEAINFQPTGGGKAAITGDFVLTATEVNPVLRALRENGIEVTALHNHMLDDEPRLFFMHFWANDDAQKLARGLAAALSHVAVAAS
ncbi:DUF1259 domain-containing protein [Sphingopyxis indica]|uniref:DUF1259 domain-containing protein n=1 Tax=Sphingopyxis indica TaxID=436663 RepID=UPI002939093F|nr:DUF1259 domain-containing protein [Sphingopyxis indica]WOF44988.1 DUF1259 domain-containing protein [Sphingopyxis indica]